MKTRKCAACGKKFTPSSNRQIYCKGPHYHTCPVCGKAYEVTNVEKLKNPPTACSYECRAKRTQLTSIEKYGCKAPGNNPEAREKAKATCLKNNGTEYAMKSDAVRQKAKATLIEKYGVDNAAKSKEVKQKRAETCRERYGDKLPFNLPESYKKQHETIQQRYGVPYYCMTDHCISSQGKIVSNANKAFIAKLDDFAIQCESELHIANRSYDIHIPEFNTLIEIDPSYTHSIIPTHWGTSCDKYYHRDKTQLAIDNGYRCIHLFDWDDWDKVIDMFKPRQRVYARNCEIYRLNLDVAVEFLDKYHLQGSCRGQLLCLGLVHRGELLQVMTFGKSRYDKSHAVELLRLCTKPGYSVVGGASRLFSFATNEYGLSNIISYCDRAKFTGDVYEKLGMKLIRVTPPQEVWSRGTEKITANLLRQRGYDQLFNTNHGKGTSNEQLMLEDGWLPVYDCGQLVYSFK